uniref:Spectrin repeat containing, nuclear envelope 1b n=1 Tax=Oncorhynchus kisutch TaxID=8019 RepID=A0A8C7KDH8_ONCKI
MLCDIMTMFYEIVTMFCDIVTMFCDIMTMFCSTFITDEQEAVQKRTFTKWINSHLTKRKPPLEVTDLFEDIKDGVKLLALLEVLSGQRLPCEQGRQLKRIHWVSNIGTALRFLEGRKIKLVNIHATDIADGRPSIVLGLIWTVILYFQIEELTSNLLALEALSSSTSSVDSMASSSETGSPALKREVAPKKFQGNAKKALLRWVQSTAAKYGIEVKDFGASWRSGVAFHSVVHAIRPDLVDMEVVRRRSNRENLEEAFSLAENELGIPRLLDPEDVDVDKPDEKSIMTYVAQFLKHYPNPHHSETDGQGEEREERKVLRELKVWLEQLERDVLQVQGAEGNITDKYQGFKSFRVQYEIKMKQTEPLLQPVHKDGKLSVDQALVKQALRISLLHRAEIAQREEIPIQQAHEETANVIQRKLEQHKEILKNLESHKQTFQQIHRERSVNGVPVPPEHLQDMAERFNYVSTSSYAHLIKLEFWEIKYRLMAFLILAESKLKSWIIKYGRRDSVELLLQSYITFIEGHMFFEQYETTFKALRQSADVYVKSDGSSEGVGKFLSDASAQWRNLSVEVRSVRSMLEEVISNWEKYSSTVAGLQAWLEDAEQMLNQSENDKRDFFRNLPHWIQQHLDMNDAGNFLIETCDETVSRDLKQQLLILNGRWRELFVKVKHSAPDGITPMTSYPLSSSHQIKERSLPLLRDAQSLLPALEEMEKNITGFYQALEKAITQCLFTLHCLLFLQELVTFTQSCKKCLTVIENNHQSVQRTLDSSKTLQHLDMALLQKRVADLQASSQAMINESTEWKNHVEVNSSLMKRFDESRGELEKVLKVAQAFLNERGNPEDLLKRHTEFFGQLEQQVLDAFLKTCDELTDTVPREEQQSLQETVRKLHKHWKDVQTEAPYHLLHLKVEVERSKLMVSMQECQSELTRENRHLVGMGSERLIKEHRDFFREKGPQSLCEKKLQLIEELCQKLPDSNPAHQTLDSSKKAYSELWEEIDSTHHNLMQHPDKWEDWLQYIQHGFEAITDLGKLDNLCHSPLSPLQELRNDAELQEGNLGWLKSRLAVLIEICSETDAQSQAGAINKLSTNFKGLLSYLTEVRKDWDCTLLPLSAGARRLRDREQAERAVAALQTSYDQSLGQAKEKQNTLEKVLSLWQKYEKDRSSFVSCLERCESTSKPESHCLPADKTKLESELQDLITFCKGGKYFFMALIVCDFPVICILYRIKELQSQLFQVEQFDQSLLKFSQWSENLFSTLHSTSLVNITDLQPAVAQVKETLAALQKQSGVRESLELQAEGLCASCEPQDAQLLQGRQVNSLQPYLEVQQLAELRLDCLGKLEAFLEVRKRSYNSGVDGSGSRTSCRVLADGLSGELDTVRNLLGTKQSEAEALGALWSSFRQRKEQLLKNVEDIKEKLGFWLRFFNQLEDELQSQEHEEQWLRDKGQQLAQRDAELAGEVLREISLLETTWEDTKRLITDSPFTFQVSERIENNIEHLSQSLALSDDVQQISEEIEGWTNSSMMELSESLNNLIGSQRMETRLSALQVGYMDRVNSSSVGLPHTTSAGANQYSVCLFQVLEADLRKKLSQVQKLYEQAKGNLRDFSSQRKQLEDYITQMSDWLKSIEQSLMSSPIGSDLEDICRNQQGSIDSTRESLNTLCRKYPSEELAGLGSALTDLIKGYESVNQLSSRTLASLQHGLQKHFNELVREFHSWLSGQREVVKECSDQSGDTSIVERKLQKLKGALERVEDGEVRLTQVCEEGEKLLLHLPKASADQVQQHISSIQHDWDCYVEQCRLNQQALEDSTAQLNGRTLEAQELRQWLEHMEQRVTSELPEEKHRGLEKATLEGVEEYHQEVLKERDSFERLCQESQVLNEGGRGDGGETRAAVGLQSQHQALLRRVRERLRCCQVNLQEQEAFKETLQSTWSWLNGMKERLGTLNSTLGNKVTLEKRLGLVQDILLMKGEGEVKLNMAVGKGEQVLKHHSVEGQEAISSQLQNLKDAWASMLMTSMSCHSRLEWTVAQWSNHQDSKGQLQQWMESVEQEVGLALDQQPGLKEKAYLLERLRALQADVEAHAAPLARLTETAAELHEKTGDQAFGPEQRMELNAHFADITAVVKGKVQAMENRVTEHEHYLEAVRDFNDWLASAKEELQRWSDLSGDSTSVNRKLAKVQELIDSRQRGRERLSRVQHCGAATRDHTGSAGFEAVEREEAALLSAWEQWERGALQNRAGLETALSQLASSEQEFNCLAAQLEVDLQEFSSQLQEWRHRLSHAEGKNSREEAVQGWQIAKDTLEGLVKMEPMSDSLKFQLNGLCRFSKDLGTQSERVSSHIKEYNRLSLQASRECQNKEKLLEQQFRAAFREFQQWLVNAKINTAKCFDVPQNLSEASSSLQKIQEFLSDREQGHSKLNAVVLSGELVVSIAAKDRVDAVRAKMSSAREDWKTLMSNLHQRETALQNLQSQMKDFEASVEPLQEWLNGTEVAVQESSTRLHDLTAKKQELHKLQSVLEELASQEVQLIRLREKAQLLWDGHAARKSFVHHVSQLSAQYLALTNLTKEKASRIDRIVNEHQLFSQGLKELQNWVADTSHMLQTYRTPTADKNVLDSRMIKLEALLTARQEKEIQLKMLVTRGESVQRNTSVEGVPVVCKNIQDLKDSWDTLLSASIQCKSQLEGALSQWTSYQEDVCQFVGWVERVEESLDPRDKQCSEMRDKTANLGKAKSHVIISYFCSSYMSKYLFLCFQTAVGKAEELVQVHQEYERGLNVFEAWLEQEQEKLGCYTQLEGDVDTLEETLQKLQELQVQCTEGQALLNTLLDSRDQVVPWGVPQIEDRVLETLQQNWNLYQGKLGDTRTQLNSTLAKLRQMEQKFQGLDSWLNSMESKGQLRSHRRSDRATKDAQLQLIKSWQEEVLVYQEEVEGLSVLAQQVIDETHISSRVSTRATQLTSRYHALLLHLLESIKQLQVEVCCIEEAQNVFRTFSDWLSSAKNNFSTMAISISVVDRLTMERKMKTLEALQGDMEQGHSFLKTMREKTERAVAFLEEPEAEQLREEVDAHRSQLEGLMAGLRTEHSSLEKCISLSKDFLDKYKAQAQWLAETKALLSSPIELKAELYQKKAQLAKYKTIQQTVQSHESAVRSVVEKGEVLLDMVCDPTIRDNMNRLQTDYQELCTASQVQSLVEWVKEHECYNSELQEVEKGLLQMSSRLVTSDSMQTCSMETATQQLARHKAIMEEIASFEERLTSLKEKGDDLVSSCTTDQMQAKTSQQVKAHHQGTRDSYSAICSSAQCVYQSLDRELQKHVSHQDTLQQCQTWLSTVNEELLLHCQPPFGMQEALKQVKHYRALQEQASTYLDLVSSVCDLSDDAVRATTAEVQQVKHTMEERMLSSQELCEGWREIKEQKQELSDQFQDMEQQLLSLSRRPAELETKIALNMLTQAKEFSQQLQNKQATLSRMTESVSRLTAGQDSPEHGEIGRLSHAWLGLFHQANRLKGQRQEDLQRIQEYHNCITAMEALFEQMSKEWDNLARTDAESSSEHLEALKKLAVALGDQKGTLEDLKDQRQKVTHHLNLDDKELVKEQISHFEQRWVQLQSLINRKIQDSVLTLEDMAKVEARLREAREWAEEQQPGLSEAMKMSPPPELAQSFLFDHLSICSELEAKQLLLAQAMSDADRLLAHLGLNECQRLQQLISDTQAEVESLSVKVVQRRKHLSKAFTERTQFLQAVNQSITWVQQNEKKAQAEEYIALLPDDLAKQVKACRNIQSSLKAYQSELTSLWSQGRDLMKDATQDEKVEMLTKLQELQNIFEKALQKCVQRLQELDNVLVSRKYFKADLEKTCQWLKQADIVTFPEINLMNGDLELNVQLLKYRQIVEQAMEYENLLLIVQRTGQEILPTLNEVDHCYLDEKLNALPQKYNSILALAKEKQEKIEQAILARKEYASFIDVTHKALKELEEQFHNLGLQPVGLQTEEVVNLLSDYKALQVDLGNLGLAVSELNQKKEGFRSTGQPWRPEELTQLVSLYNGLKRLIEQRVEHLDDTLESFEDHKAMAMQVDSELKATKEELVKVNAETQSAEERLKNYHALAGSLQSASSHLSRLMEQMDNLAPQLDKAAHDASREQVVLWQEELQSLQSAVGELIVECENRFVQSKDFETEVKRTLDWLQHIRDELGCAVVVVDVRVEKVQEEIRKQQIMQDEVQSRLRIVEALSSREKQKYTSANELVPAHVDLSLEEMAKLQADVQQAMSSKQVRKYHTEARQMVIELMNEAEQKLTEFSTAKAATFLEAEEKLRSHRVKEDHGKIKSVFYFDFEASKATISRSMTTVWQRWTRLRSVARGQERVLEDTAQEWGTFREKVLSMVEDLQSRIIDCVVEKASKATLQSVLDQHELLIQDVERELSSLTLLRQYALSLLHDVEVPSPSPTSGQDELPSLKEIRAVQDHLESLLQQAQTKGTQAGVELRDREGVEKNLSVVKAWIQETRELLPNPTSDIDALLQELEVVHGDVIGYRQHVDKIAEQQQSKYLDLYTILPSEISMQLAEVSLALGAIQDQVLSKEKEIQKTRDIKEDISSRIHDVSEKMKAISTSLNDKASDVHHAKDETKCLCDDLESCHRTLSELDAAVQEFDRWNPILAKQLSDAIVKLGDIHHHTARLAECRSIWLKKAGTHLEEYNEMLDFIVRWSEKAKGLVRANIIWNSSSHLQEQIRMDESVLRESRELHGDLQAMGEKVDLLSEVLQTENMSQQVCELSRHTEELQQTIRTRLQSLQDAAKSMEPLEYEVKTLQVALEQVQATLTSPDLSRQSLKEQLAQRQRLLSEMEGFKLQVQAVQLCQSALRVPEEVMPDLAICHTALGLQQEASQLQHVVIQQCNILQEAVVQYEQYEQEAKHFQGLIEDAHRVIQDRPIPTSTIQELQAQILHHEELAQKIKGYQEEIASLNSKCQMLTVKAKHDTMLLTVSDTERVGLTVEDLDGDIDKPSVVMMTAGRCHTLLSPVTEESGEEGTSSEISSPVCRSPSPSTHTQVSHTELTLLTCVVFFQMGRDTLPRAPVQELNDPMFESEANLDDLQRSWETLENVISEKQRSLYEALEKKQCNQGSLQSISSKMEAIESKLNKPLEADRSTDSHMEAHQAVVEEVQRLQEEIDKLQTSFSDELGSDAVDDTAHQLAMQSTLTVLSERMATIQMKASGERQLLEERVSDRLEEQTLRHYLNQADQMDQWLHSTREALRPSAEEEQLIDGQNMLQEIEQKVVALSELTMRSESLLLEGRQETRMDMREDTEQLARKLRTLKGSLLELQRMLQDKHNNIQDQEESESDSTLSQGPIVQDCLVQAHTTLSQHHQDSLQRQRELEEQLAEQKKLLQSVASRGEEILINMTEPCSPEILLERETRAAQYQMRQRWDSLRKELSTKLQLLQKTLEQDHKQQVLTSPSINAYSQWATLVERLFWFQPDLTGASEGKVIPMEQHLYQAVSATSSWLDDVENTLFSGPTLLTENAETQLQNQEVTGVVSHSRGLLGQPTGLCAEDQVLLEDTLDCLTERLQTLDSALERRCEHMRTRMQELTAYQTESQLVLADLTDTKCQILQTLAGATDRPGSTQLEVIAEAEEGLREFEQRITQLKTRGTELQAEQMSTNEMLKLQDAYEELVMTVGSRRSSLNHNMALKGQYERALQDLADLVDTAQDKMAGDQRVIASSVEEVQILLDKHKEFFQSLESHMILTESFFRKISGLVVPREKQALEEILTLAQGVLKQAHRRGVALEYILETWSHLVPDFQALCMQLEAVEGSIPTVGLVEETEESLTERSLLYQSLKGRLMEHQHKLSQVLEEGKRLQLSVCCPGLDTKLTVLGEHWLSNTTKVNKELQRLEAILKHWTRYQKESSELIGWLQSALERLDFWNNQAVVVPQEMETRRDHLSTFLDFCKEVESRSSLKNSVLTEGNQLLRLKRVGTAALRSDLARIDSEWTQLLTLIPGVQEKLHQLQMEKLASRHAISELVNWISLMENVIGEDEENLKGAVGSTVIQDYLQKYKGFRVDVHCKQLTVYFVNQSVLQISDQDVESRRSDQTDFAEKLGVMNRRWQLLQGLITERVQFLETLLEAWLNYENNIQGLKTWLLTQEGRLKRKPRIEDLTSVQNALNDCQEMEEKVKEKEGEVERVEEQACALIQNKTDEACAVVMETLQAVNHTWANLDHLIGQLKISLVSVLDQWSLYKLSSEEMNGYLMEGRYSVSRFRLLTGSLEAVQLQVESLQSSGLRQGHVIIVPNHLCCAQISERLKRSKALLQLWQHYKELYGKSSSSVQLQEVQADRLLETACTKDITDEEVSTWIQDCSVIQELGDQLKQQVDTSTASAVQSDHLSLTQRLATVEQALSRQLTTLQDYETFSEQLGSLGRWMVEGEEALKIQDPNSSSDLSIIQDRMEELKRQILRFSSMAHDLERLNELGYRLPLNDIEIKRMQNLNRSWSAANAQTTERFSKLQSFLLQQQTFLEKCETWMEFLVQTEKKLAVEISGNYQSLMEQQRAHKLFQAEMFSRQQILHSIISDGQRMLAQGQVDDRDEFNRKLLLLSNQWQGVVRRAQQRQGIIDSLIRQWQRYRDMSEKLRKWLVEISHPAEALLAGAPIPLQQARSMLDAVQLKEKVLQRQQGSYILTVEAGKQLLLSADSRAEVSLQGELTDIQERWRHATICLEEQRRELDKLDKDWETCERGIEGSLEKLRKLKRQFSQSLPDHHEDLQAEQMRCKDLEKTFDGWTEDLAHLTVLRESLSSYISAEDLSVLQERMELLHRQWEEICHQLSLRQQQVGEKLSEWAVFKEKNRELCDWLTQMESKVSQNGDVRIEEMIEKLRKDYYEEIAVAQENKQQLYQLGERLAKASHENKASEIEHKLSMVGERWQHLLDLIGARLKKLRETLVAVQQLDKNMISLRSWLTHIETELSRPILYDTCDSQEIQRKLDLQQELQRDIEKHSTSVASALNLCEVLLHDCDVCATDTECDSIQQTTRNLDRRWRRICALSMERRLKIEETWRLWQKIIEDFMRFEEWLVTSEKTAALPNSSGVLYTVAKEELKKFEAFQCQSHESLTQLETINKQYRRLARENRTDSSCRLGEMSHDGNQRWDNLQKRVASILRRLKHFVSQREEFEKARDSVVVWLTEMDLQLTNIEHFSECDIRAKIKQLRAFQQEISVTTGKVEHIFHQGEVLLQKSEPLDAVVIEKELEELRRYYQEVFGRVERYYKKLIQLPLTGEEYDVSFSDKEIELDEPGDLSSILWSERLGDCLSSPLPSLTAPLCTGAERSGMGTPASMDSIPLEWDHDYDLRKRLESASGALGLASEHEEHGEEGSYQGSASMRLLGECRSSIDTVKRVGYELKGEGEKASGLADPIDDDSQTTGVIQRWELLQAQALSKEMRLKQNLQQWQQFNSDLNAVWAWLEQAGEELEQQRRLDLSTDIQTIELRIKKLKELQKAVDKRKATVLSINLCSAEFVQSATEESQDLKARLKEMNNRWDRLGTSLGEWRAALQKALMQCHDFHEMSHGLLLWLENIDRRRNEIVPIDPIQDSNTLHEHHKTLLKIRCELLDTQRKVLSLQDMSLQLLVNSEGSDCLEAKEKVHVIGNRLKLLFKEVTRDLKELEKILDTNSSQQDLSMWSSADELDSTSGSISPVSGRSTPSRLCLLLCCCVLSVSYPIRYPVAGSASSPSEAEGKSSSSRFLYRVLRVAVPLQLLFLLLLVVMVCLVPVCEGDFDCSQSNNFARSFHPMLQYTNGPPPV